MASFDYDVLIIGSGFGGSVAALRAAEKGYRVGVMESGRRWRDEDIPKTQWDLPHFLWFPAAELYGIQRIEYLDDVLILSGAGVGGGSHVYANTLYVPPKQFFDAPEWAGIADWADELAPHIDQATRMLGVVRYPYMPTDVDRVLQQVATEMGEGRRSTRPRWGCTSAAPASRRTTRTSAALGRAAPDASRAATATSAAATTPRTSGRRTTSTWPRSSASRSTSCTRSTTSRRSREAASRCTHVTPAGGSERHIVIVARTRPSR
jgi:choline dehydrogenase-like flavoprotein